jgi:hypothetical protein
LRRAMQDSLDGITSIVHFKKVQMDRSCRGHFARGLTRAFAHVLAR